MNNYVSDAVPVEGSSFPTSPTRRKSRPKIADTLVWCSAVQHHFAQRDEEKGTWFIQHAMDEIMNNPSQGMDLTMKNVTDLASKSELPVRTSTDTIKKMYPIPCVTHDTRRADFFFKG